MRMMHSLAASAGLEGEPDGSSLHKSFILLSGMRVALLGLGGKPRHAICGGCPAKSQ
jgi:hypothetical protein